MKSSSSSKALWYGSLAAGAAVGPVAHGTVIYTDLVPDVSGSMISWDMDNGGSTDFRLEVTVNAGSEKTGIVPTNPNSGIALAPNSNVDRMALGETIGS